MIPQQAAGNHRRVDNPAIPYVTNSNVTACGPHYVAGSNCLSSVRGFVERRPGFPTYTSDNFGANNTIKSFFTWQRWAGAYIVMCNVVDSGANTSKVYKLQVGTDTTFQLILTSSSNTTPFSFCVSSNFIFMSNGTDQKKYDGTTVTNWGTTAPVSAPNLTNSGAGNVPGAIGHTYVYAYGNSSTGYVSDISPVSASTSAASRTWTIDGARSTDTQIDKIHVFRTEDGGSVYYALSNSPIANPGSGTWSIADNDADASLTSTQAPLAGVNAKILTTANGNVFWANRIWVFYGDTLYYSGWEEITNGTVEEECFPTINKRSFGREIIGLGTTKEHLLIFTSNEIFRVTGDSLASFTWDTLAHNLGSRQRLAITSVDDAVAWLDSGNTIRVTNGLNQKEISIPIRPDISAIDHSQASLTIYDDGLYHWLVLCDGGAAKLRVYDLDLGQWHVPWPITGITAVGFGEVAAASYKLFLGRSAKPLAMNTAAYQDESVSYTASLTTCLVPSTDNPTAAGELEYASVETNAVGLSDISYLTDEDPSTGSYTSFVANITVPPIRTNGTNLIEKWYWLRIPPSLRVSVKFDWAAANSLFRLYTWDLVPRQVASGDRR